MNQSPFTFNEPGQQRNRKPIVTILAPAFNEADNVKGLVAFFRKIRESRPEFDFELIVVDDGSVDGTAQLVLDELADGDVARVVSLSRNFGSHAAITAGLELARGDCVITISTDLQEPLSAIHDFLNQWREGGEVIWGIRRTRTKAKGMANWFSVAFARLFRKLSDIPTYPKEGPSQILLDRKAIDVINAMPERNRNIFGMFAWVGFTQRTIAFDQLPRPAGKSKWTNKKKIRLFLDSFVEFSPAPFLITMVGGVFIAGLGLLAAIALIVVGLAGGAWVGWGLVIAAIFFLGGIQLTVLGGFGEYLWRAGDDARRRPIYVLRSVSDEGGFDAGAASRFAPELQSAGTSGHH